MIRLAEFAEEELAHLAAAAMLPEKLALDTARETVALFHEHWQAHKDHLPLAPGVIEVIERHMRRVPIV